MHIEGDSAAKKKERERQVHKLELVEQFEKNPEILHSEQVIEDPRFDEFKRLKKVEKALKLKYSIKKDKIHLQLARLTNPDTKKELSEALEVNFRVINK